MMKVIFWSLFLSTLSLHCGDNNVKKIDESFQDKKEIWLDILPADEFGGFYHKKSGVGFLQVKNTTDSSIYFNDFKSGYTTFSTFLYHSYKYPISPNKSIILQYRNQRLGDIIKHQNKNYKISLSANCYLKNDNKDSSSIKFNHIFSFGGDNSFIRNYPDSLISESVNPKLFDTVLPDISREMLKISSTNEFGFFVRKKKDNKKNVNHLIEGIIKIKNISDKTVRVVNVGGASKVNSISSMYDGSYYIPPNKSIILSFNSKVIEEQFENNLALFLNEESELNYWIEFSNGNEKQKIPFAIQLSKSDLNHIIE
jgi:hypothetical protein